MSGNPDLTKSIRFAVMCDNESLSSWQVAAIEKLTSHPNIYLVLIIVNPVIGKPEKIKNISSWSGLLFSVYRRFLIKRTKSLQRVNIKTLFENVPRITCETIKKGEYSEYFQSSDLEQIKAQHLDFIIRFGYNIIRGEILTTPQYGVWSFHHGDEMKFRGGPPCFWEIYYDDPVTGSILQRLNEKLDAGIVLKRGYFPTINYSYSRNIDQAYSESANWPYQVCLDILAGRADYFEAPPSKTTGKIYKKPSSPVFILFCLKIIKNRIVRLSLLQKS